MFMRKLYNGETKSASDWKWRFETNYENKELWNTDMQVGKPYKATILKNYHILLYVQKYYAKVMLNFFIKEKYYFITNEIVLNKFGNVM